MGSELEPIRQQLEELERRLHEVGERVSRLESQAALRRAPVAARAPPKRREVATPEAAADATSPHASGTLALVGRMLVALGGAFAFRAISDREWVDPGVGALAALLYAACWLLWCDREAGRGRRQSAVFSGLTGLAIAHPLVWETTLAFELLAPATAAALLAAFAALGVIVATRRDLGALGAAAVLAHVGSGIGLMVASQAFLPLTLSLLVGALAVEAWVTRSRMATLRWPAALGVDVGALMLVVSTVHRVVGEETPGIASGATLATLLALPALYLGHSALRSLWRAAPLRAFDGIQTGVALLLGIGGSARLLLALGWSTLPLGVAALALGTGLYLVSLGHLRTRPEAEPAYTTWTGLAGGLVLAGCALALPWGSGALAWTACGLAALAIGLGVAARLDPLVLPLHGVAYAAAAAANAGLLAASLDGLIAPPAAWQPLPPAAPGIALALAAGVAGLWAAGSDEGRALTRLPAALLTLLLAAALSGAIVRALASLLALDPEGGAAATALATTRTAVLAALAVTLAWAARRGGAEALRWIVPVPLVAGAAKLAWEDLRLDEPLALFAGLALYGGALIAVPRLLRRNAGGARPATGFLRASRGAQNPGRGPRAGEHLGRRDRA